MTTNRLTLSLVRSDDFTPVTVTDLGTGAVVRADLLGGPIFATGVTLADPSTLDVTFSLDYEPGCTITVETFGSMTFADGVGTMEPQSTAAAVVTLQVLSTSGGGFVTVNCQIADPLGRWPTNLTGDGSAAQANADTDGGNEAQISAVLNDPTTVSFTYADNSTVGGTITVTDLGAVNLGPGRTFPTPQSAPISV